MTEVLVLNASYEPIRIIPTRRALVLLLQRKAELVEAGDAVVRSAGSHMALPLVVRLLRYVNIPRVRRLACTRRAVLVRDRETCQYCGAQPGRAQLTIDHVLPRTQGGTTAWENVVAACAACNHRKGGRTPEQAGMSLLRPPRQPATLAIALHTTLEHHTAWHKYTYRV
jgi:5-methylcytosine-specific restriction endonuclease McrA